MSQKIVVIEDSVEVCESIASIVKLGGYQVLTATNGRLGIELVQQNEPDLILCDIMMPELDGYGVLRILSKDPATANIPFIYLTAKTDLRDFRMGMNLGADDYITKPFDGLELLKVIELRLKKNDLIKTTFQNRVSDISEFFNKASQLPGFHKLSGNRHSRLYKKKEYVYLKGHQPDYVYLIEKGAVKTFTSNDEGKELIIGLHGEGSFIGFVPLLEDKPHNDSAIVTEDAEVYLIPRQDFLTMIYTNKEIARKFIAMLSSHLYKAENAMFELAYRSVRQRVATALLNLSEQQEEGGPVIRISRKDLAKMVGTTTESLNRTLADFKAEEFIELLEKGIKIIHHAGLETARK